MAMDEVQGKRDGHLVAKECVLLSQVIICLVAYCH